MPVEGDGWGWREATLENVLNVAVMTLGKLYPNVGVGHVAYPLLEELPVHPATYGHLCIWCLARGCPEPGTSRPGPFQTELPPPRGPRGSYLVKLLLYFLFAHVSRSSILEAARARVDVRAAVRMDKTVHPPGGCQTRTRLPDTEIRFCTWNGESAWFESDRWTRFWFELDLKLRDREPCEGRSRD